MTTLYPVAGCKIFIGQVLSDKNADFVLADFNTQSWVEVDGWTQMGQHGDTAALISSQLINRARDIKQKGTANAGSMQNVFAEIPSDAGQIALIAAAAPGNRASYAFRIDYNDKPSGGANPTQDYFVALVMNADAAGGAANTVRNLESTMEINSNIPRRAAA